MEEEGRGVRCAKVSEFPVLIELQPGGANALVATLATLPPILCVSEVYIEEVHRGKYRLKARGVALSPLSCTPKG